ASAGVDLVRIALDDVLGDLPRRQQDPAPPQAGVVAEAQVAFLLSSEQEHAVAVRAFSHGAPLGFSSLSRASRVSLRLPLTRIKISYHPALIPRNPANPCLVSSSASISAAPSPTAWCSTATAASPRRRRPPRRPISPKGCSRR